jgi:hypothetical protein
MRLSLSLFKMLCNEKNIDLPGNGRPFLPSLQPTKYDGGSKTCKGFGGSRRT